MNKRKVFSREFKLEALRALDAGQKQATELARELGIPRSRLYAWRAQLQGKDSDDAFPGHGRRSGPEAELAALKTENARLREEIWSKHGIRTTQARVGNARLHRTKISGFASRYFCCCSLRERRDEREWQFFLFGRRRQQTDSYAENFARRAGIGWRPRH